MRPSARHWNRAGTKRKKTNGDRKALSRGATADFLYAPTYSAGRVLVAAMLDSILYQVCPVYLFGLLMMFANTFLLNTLPTEHSPNSPTLIQVY